MTPGQQIAHEAFEAYAQWERDHQDELDGLDLDTKLEAWAKHCAHKRTIDRLALEVRLNY